MLKLIKLASASLLLILFTSIVFAQNNYPFTITLEPVIPEGFKGLQSYSWAKYGDKVLLAGCTAVSLLRLLPNSIIIPNLLWWI